MPDFIVGEHYTREQVGQIAGLSERDRSGGSWMTGYTDWNGATYVFTNVGVPGRTGHDYANRWVGKNLIWYGKTNSHRGQPQIDRMISNTRPVHLFWRAQDRSPFTYAGDATAVEANSETPIQIVWSFDGFTSGSRVDIELQNEPKWHRGPPPTDGGVWIERVDGPTDVYLFRATGRVDALFDLPAGHVLIKVGMSNNPERRLTELNAGFPPGSKVKWSRVSVRHFADGSQAWRFEGERLERLRLDRYWRGGEFAVVPEAILPDFLS
ncbi:hypothetical protein NKJ23_13710 [Mesorhizobium sp. M0184]|uniref:hypothetical protein n=1 Tax=Mesorhizobium sp. M0184 TaxID=2956906 RepID=UPI0033391DA6